MHPSRLPLPGTTAVAALALALGACTIERQPAAAADTLVSAVVDSASAARDTVVDAAIAGAAAAVDSVIAKGDAARAAGEIAAIVNAPPPVTMDTTRDGGATPAELAGLVRQLAMPLPGIRTSALLDTFGEARGGGTRTHRALDILAPRGTPVLSAAPGRLLRMFSSENGGLMVYAADSTERFVLMYAHLDAYAPGLRDGQPLVRGQPLGTVGTTGNAPPDVPHLHFAIARTDSVSRWWLGAPVDPRPLLQRAVRD